MTPILDLDSLNYRYPGQSTPALRGASVSLPAGTKVALLGRNGCGKSTLLIHCNGILRPDSGVVRFAGQPIAYDRRSLQELRRHVGLVFQHPDDQLFSASVAQDLSFGPLNIGLSERETRRQVQAAAEMCEITELLDRPVHALSGGEKTRVALAGVLAMDPVVIIADEITTSLDPWIRRQVLAIFERLAAGGKTIVLATHDVGIARHWADMVTVMDAGRIMAADAPGTVFTDRALLAYIGPEDPWCRPLVELNNY